MFRGRFIVGKRVIASTLAYGHRGRGSRLTTRSLMKSDEEWRKTLSPEQYRILRQKGTEYPGTGEYNKFYPKDGAFHCAGCNAKLYTSKSKFDSGCGWPAFYEGIPGAITEIPDADGAIGLSCSRGVLRLTLRPSSSSSCNRDEGRGRLLELRRTHG